jgi:DNA-directed RNA polymerase specialized sigma24 family protein
MEEATARAGPELGDGTSSARGGAVPMASRASRRETISLEEFRRLRPQLEAFVGEHFPGLSRECREEVVSDAFLALHKARRGSNGFVGEEAQTIAYLRRAATSLGIDRRRRANDPARSAEAQDPCGRLLSELRAAGPSPQEEVEAALSDREVGELVGALTDQEAGVVKRTVLWGWVPREVMADLGVTRKRYELVRARALMKVARRLEEAGGELWERGKARLIAALVAGTASAAQVKQARALAKQSADFRLALAKYEATLHSVTVAIPTEVALRDAHRAGVMERAIAVVERARDTATGALGGGSGDVPVVASQAGSGAARGAGVAGGGGILAKLGASGVGAKIIAACLAGGAAAGTCIAAGVVPGVHLSGLHGSPTPAHRGGGPGPDDEGSARGLPAAGRPANPGATPVPTNPNGGGSADGPGGAQTTPATTTTTTTPAPSPPPVATEFGVEPGAAPSSTSSSSGGSGGAAGASAASREFGL